jgi:hypothetical protein
MRASQTTNQSQWAHHFFICEFKSIEKQQGLIDEMIDQLRNKEKGPRV